MPRKSPRPCPGCRLHLIRDEKYCEACQRLRHRQFQKTRTDDNAFYRSSAWRLLRAKVLQEEPWCVMCKLRGRYTPATIADHILPRQDFPELELARTNVRAVCKSCHERHGSRSK